MTRLGDVSRVVSGAEHSNDAGLGMRWDFFNVTLSLSLGLSLGAVGGGGDGEGDGVSTGRQPGKFSSR